MGSSLGFDPDRPLLLSSSDQWGGKRHFVNATRLESLFKDSTSMSHSRMKVHRIFLYLQENCIAAAIQQCHNENCTERRKRMEECAPPCDWLLYRDWVLTTTACLTGTYPNLQEYSAQSNSPFPQDWANAVGEFCEAHQNTLWIFPSWLK